MIHQKSNDYVLLKDFAYLKIEGKYSCLVKIDLEDVEKIKHLRWYSDKNNYIYAKKCGKFIKLHRFLLDYEGELTVDHINRDKKDNRKSNLRIADRSTQNKNRNTPWNIEKSKTITTINGVKYNSISEASRCTGIPRTTLNDIKLNRYKSSKKYINLDVKFE